MSGHRVMFSVELLVKPGLFWPNFVNVLFLHSLLCDFEWFKNYVNLELQYMQQLPHMILLVMCRYPMVVVIRHVGAQHLSIVMTTPIGYLHIIDNITWNKLLVLQFTIFRYLLLLQLSGVHLPLNNMKPIHWSLFMYMYIYIVLREFPTFSVVIALMD